MKRFLFFLLMVLGVLNLVCCSEPKAEEPDELAQRIFQKLKENDQAGFEEIALHSDKEFEKVFRKSIMADAEGRSEEEVEEKVDRFLKKLSELKESVSSSFSKVRSEAENDGVDWSKAEYVRASYQVKKNKGFDKTDVRITFKDNGREYQFKLDDCIKVDGEWFLSDDMRWNGRSLPLKH